MEKICPNCGNPIPEEAAFCLKCFYSINNSPEPKEKKEKALLFPWLKQHGKKLGKGLAAVLVFSLIMGICIFAMKSINSDNSLKPETDTTIIKETAAVAVTDKHGQAVTNEAGEQVFDVVEVTKIQSIPVSTTKKQGFLDKIFSSETKNDESTSRYDNNKNTADGKTPETTEKKDFFDQLLDSVFGDDEKNEPATDEKTTTEEHGTTENTTAPSSTTTQTPSTTAKPTQTTSTTVGTTTVTTTESGSYYFEYEAQSAAYPDGNIALTKYIGDACVVTIPSYVDGRKVAEIETDCFKDDPKIKEINFDDSTTYTVSLSYHCFNNLTSLTKVVFNNKGFHIGSAFAYNCPITYLGKGGSSENKLVDGAYYKGTAFLWFTAHPSYTTLTFPDWCTKIDNGHNLEEVSNLKVINIHKNVLNIPRGPLHYGNGLRAINVEEGHPEVFSSEGVLFYKYGSDTVFSCIYPYHKTDKTFKVPKNSYLSIGSSSSKTVNPYLEEVRLTSTSYLKSPGSKYFYDTSYPNLKKIYLPENHPQYDTISKTFTGEIIVIDI